MREITMDNITMEQWWNDMTNTELYEEYDGSGNPQEAVQVGGNHYKNLAIEPIDIITKNKLDYLEGNVLKYLLRHKNKNGREDLYKAIHYLQMMLVKYKELYNVGS